MINTTVSMFDDTFKRLIIENASAFSDHVHRIVVFVISFGQK